MKPVTNSANALQGTGRSRDIVSVAVVGALDDGLRRILDNEMIPCFEPIGNDREISAFLHLGPSWLAAIGVLGKLLAEASPACAESAHDLVRTYDSHCRILECICTPHALRARKDAARTLVDRVANVATRNLDGREFISFHVENNSLPFAIRTRHALQSEPSIVGIGEVTMSPTIKSDPGSSPNGLSPIS